MRLQRLLLWTGRGTAACSALLPFTGAIRPAGPAAWGLLVAAVFLMLAGGEGERSTRSEGKFR